MGWRWCLDNTIVPALGSLFPQRRKLFLSLFWMSLPVRSSGGWRIRSGAPLYGPLQAIEGKIYATGGLSGRSRPCGSGEKIVPRQAADEARSAEGKPASG